MQPFRVNQEQIQQFQKDGFLIVEQLFSPQEARLLNEIARVDREMLSDATDRKDADGTITRLSVQNDLDDGSVFAAVVRSRRMAETTQSLLGDEVYHYHHKVMLKEPLVGGAWEWHQDYGYWYNNGCLFPDMASCTIAIDHATKENGCLQVIRGSHLMGRVEHGTVGGQTGADMERVKAALDRMELVHIEAEPGTACFFHGNLLHRSDQNRSENPRWSLICCYNTARNDPYKDSKHPRYSPMEIWDDSKVLEIGKIHLEQLCANDS